MDSPHMNTEVLKKLKKLHKKCDTFLASEFLLKQILRILDSNLNKAGKLPCLLTCNENMVAKVDGVDFITKFQMKTHTTVGLCPPR